MTDGIATELEIELGDIGRVPVTVTRWGEGQPVLLLHGGGGPQTVAPFGQLLAERHPAAVVVPVHPGFGGTQRPAGLTTVRELGRLYAALLDRLDLPDVAVVGSSLGGWIAAELGLLPTPRISGIVLVDAVGIEVPDHPVVDFFSLTFPEIAQRSYFEPERFRIDPAKMAPAAQAVLAGNRAALAVYGGATMVDPTLRSRLAASTRPTLVLWGDADRIADADYGRALAASIPGAAFRLLPRTGHLPQLETPDELLPVVWEFIATLPAETA